jgi:hypothetical protein
MKSQKTKTNPQNKEKINKERPKARVRGEKKSEFRRAAPKLRSQGSEIRFFKSTARLRSWERALGRACVLKTKISKPDGVRSPRTYFEQKRVIPSLEPPVESFGFT